MKKKIVLGLTALVLVVGLTIGGTLAYMQSTTDTKVNTFTIGSVKLTLDETYVQNSQLIPGSTISKTPVLTVKGGSEASFVRAKIEVPAKLAALVDINVDSAKWEKKADGYYYLNSGAIPKNSANTVLPALFSAVTVKTSVTNEQLAALSADDLKVSITGYAIQAANFADETAAWKAFTAA